MRKTFTGNLFKYEKNAITFSTTVADREKQYTVREKRNIFCSVLSRSSGLSEHITESKYIRYT